MPSRRGIGSGPDCWPECGSLQPEEVTAPANQSSLVARCRALSASAQLGRYRLLARLSMGHQEYVVRIPRRVIARFSRDNKLASSHRISGLITT